MFLSRIHLIQFKNHQSTEIELNNGLNALFGKTGVEKLMYLTLFIT